MSQPKSLDEIEISKKRTHKIRFNKHINDAMKAKARAIRNLKRANLRLKELGVKEKPLVYCKEPDCKGDH